MAKPRRRAAMPVVLQKRSTDEFTPPPDSARARRAIRRVSDEGPASARRSGHALGNYWASRHGTAAGLLALNDEFADDYYRVPREAALDPETPMACPRERLRH